MANKRSTNKYTVMTERSSNKTMMVLPATPPEKANSKTVMVFSVGISGAVATEAASVAVLSKEI